MKIIGTSEKGYMIDLSSYELAHLIGNNDINYSSYPQIKVGDEIEISKMYSFLNDLENNKTDIHDYAKKIKTLVDALLQIPIPTVLTKIDPVEDK